MRSATTRVSAERKTLYYAGLIASVVGMLLFLSTFVTAIANFGNFDDFQARSQSGMLRAFGGMVLILVGRVLMKIGARGVAGSGLVLDPERARKDVEPWSRMGGGIVKDALSEVDVVKKIEDRLDAAEPAVKVRCTKCRALNDEKARFCSQCGGAM